MYTLLDGQLWDSNRISAGCQPGNLLRDPLRSQGINEPCTRFGMFRPFICINLVWCLQAATQSVNLHRRWRWRKVTEVLSTCQARQNVESLSQSWDWIGFKWSKRFHIFSSSICWIVEQLSCHLLSTTLWDSMDENAQCPMPNFVAPAACAAFSTASCCTFGKEGFIDTPSLKYIGPSKGWETHRHFKKPSHELGVMARFLQRDICESIEEHLRTEITKWILHICKVEHCGP